MGDELESEDYMVGGGEDAICAPIQCGEEDDGPDFSRMEAKITNHAQ